MTPLGLSRYINTLALVTNMRMWASCRRPSLFPSLYTPISILYSNLALVSYAMTQQGDEAGEEEDVVTAENRYTPYPTLPYPNNTRNPLVSHPSLLPSL